MGKGQSKVSKNKKSLEQTDLINAAKSGDGDVSGLVHEDITTENKELVRENKKSLAHTYLINEAKRGDGDAVSRLVHEDITTENKELALRTAAWYGHPEVVSLLLKEPDVNINAKGADSRRTSLHHAVDEGHDAIVQMLLLAKADPNSQDTLGLTSLHTAVWHHYGMYVDMLLQAGADPNIPNHVGLTSLHYASMRDDKIVALLLNGGADPNIKDKEGRIPLQLALDSRKDISKVKRIQWNSGNAIQLLINAGSDINLLGKDKDSEIVMSGLRSKQQLDESRSTGVQDLSSDKVQSTSVFVKSPAAKMIIVGKYNAGKTTLVRTMEKKEPVFIPEGAEGRTRGIEVSVHQLQHAYQDIHLYAYDFGGQPSYFPIHQVYLSPHSLFSLVADFSRIVEDERDTMQYYHTINQRVVRPVYITVGTKTDLCLDDVDEKKKRLFAMLGKIEEKERNALITRARKIEMALRQIEKKGSDQCILNYEFKGLPKEKLAEKFALVKLRLGNRPRLSENTMVVSSHEYQGIEELQQEIAKVILQNSDLFPSFSIPRTWFAIENKLRELKAKFASVDLSEFENICKENKVTNEDEIVLLLDYLRIKGQLIHYTDHGLEGDEQNLKKTVFIDPHHVTSILSLIFDHENYDSEFWMKMVTMKHLPTDQCEEAKALVEHGIISETLLEFVLKGTKMEGESEQVIDLMKQFDLCFELEQSNANLKLRSDVRYFLLPSLLTAEILSSFTEVWPDVSTATECILQLYLFTPVEPHGLFEKASVQLNDLFYNRLDMKRCMVADIHDYKDKMKMQMYLNEDGESYSMLFTVRTDLARLSDTCSTMKFVVVILMDLMKFYPTILWDWYILCPLCRISTPASRWPAENVLLNPNHDTPPVHCDLCKERMETVGGFPLMEGRTREQDDFSSVLGITVHMIGTHWQWLTRELFPSIDDADMVIDRAIFQQISPSLIDLASHAFSEWRQMYSPVASLEEIIVALDNLPRRDIIKKTGFGDDTLQRAKERLSKAPGGSTSNRNQESCKRVVIAVSRGVGGKEWRILHRFLSPRVTDLNYPEIPIIEQEFPDPTERCYQVLRKWRQQYGSEATYHVLMEALRCLKRNDVAEKVHEICNEFGVDIHDAL